MIYCVDIVRVVSFEQTLVTTQKEGHFELSLRERDDCVADKPSYVNRSGRRRNGLLLSLGAF